MKIVADQNIPFLQGVLEPFAEVVYKKGDSISAKDVRDADALLVRTRTRCDAALLEGSTVKFIGTATIGYDHIDTDYCRTHSITVATAAGCNAWAVAQYVAAAWLELQKQGLFDPCRSTVGIVGVGNVGSRIRKLAQHMGIGVLCCDPPRKQADPAFLHTPLPELLAACDVVSLHVPLVKSGRFPTSNLADAAFFDNMKPDAVFINTSRGEVVEESALLHVLDQQKIGAAVLDVWRNEPYIDLRLVEKATIGTPHIAGYSLQGKANGTCRVVRSLSAFFDLGLQNWYPEQVKPIVHDDFPTWEELAAAMPRYYAIEKDSTNLKKQPQQFEAFRNHYGYREEFF